MTALSNLLAHFRAAAVTEREKGTYFEELIAAYLRQEPKYADLYSDVWIYAAWAAKLGKPATDTGIDLVSQVRATGEYHAIQCKFHDPDHVIAKADIDSFFTASGKKDFAGRLIVSSTDHWTANAEAALEDQRPPVTKLTLYDLEASQLDWSKFVPGTAAPMRPKKTPRPHQREAIEDVLSGFKAHDRGKLLMACGTGKTFTALKIAESVAGPGGQVLFLVPSLALLSQTLTEWTQESTIPLHSFAVCSDSDVGKKKGADDDSVQTFVHELGYPATTDAAMLARHATAQHDPQHLTVVFATYHSIDVVHRAQRDHGLAAFDLVVCDEAHRTTGAKYPGEDESAFTRVHDAGYIQAAWRLYMTATPRLYGTAAKATAEQQSITLASMDDEALYGPEFHRLNFSNAVTRDLLCDYKVIVLAIEESHVNKRLQQMLASGTNELKVDDAAKIVGCWKALAKQELLEGGDTTAMRRAVAFCQVIEPASVKAKKHKVSSKHIAAIFQSVVEAYQASAPAGEESSRLVCEAHHVDGSMNASEKERELAWLNADGGAGVCRILSNVRCLSEGVDVPALDAVLFLTPRDSQVDVVQSVGRVMRKAPGKERGYVVLPVVIPAGTEPEQALSDSTTYKVVWQVLQALRSHDDRFDAMVNKLEFTGPDPRRMEVVAITDRVPTKRKSQWREKAGTGYSIGAPVPAPKDDLKWTQLAFEIGDVERAIYAKLVQKVGNRQHWEEWANDIARIAKTHIDRITQVLADKKNVKERAAFDAFAAELRDDLNPSISDQEIVEMLAQHLITRPVFEAVFSETDFAARNPISRAMQQVLDVLQEQHLEKERDTLQKFYASVQLRVQGITDGAGRQHIIKELYEKFFNAAFPRLSERLGIVYTPVEVVDFILHSVQHLLQQEFGASLGDDNVHIIDPFTGTGTFITRLLQSGLIPADRLEYKYRHEIHANEIVLLAYYIAAVNIEAVFHSLASPSEYIPFEGILLTDTFQMYEKDDLLSELLPDNSARRTRQKELDIRVIIGNPPYSAGQESANDNNQNVEYAGLDARIADTYAAASGATQKKALYDSYIRAIRWASDRIGESGVIGFVTNAGFLDGEATSGVRQCLVDEFSSLNVFHLRGNQRTSGEQSRKEGGKIFGSGSRAPIAISLLVKNPTGGATGRIHFHDIGDYLDRNQKLARVAELGSVEGIAAAGKQGWQAITPDEHGDWLGQRAEDFANYLVLGDKKGGGAAVFRGYSLGVNTSRDAWCYNASHGSLAETMAGAIRFFNEEVTRFDTKFKTKEARRSVDVRRFVDTDPSKISWDDKLFQAVRRGKVGTFEGTSIRPALYRPYSKSWLYFDRDFVTRVGQQPSLFPDSASTNLAIAVNVDYKGDGNVALMTDVIADFHSAGDTQCFPLYLYTAPSELEDSDTPTLALDASDSGDRHHAITDAALEHFRSAYPGEAIAKDDLFYYIYGILHSRDYLARYADNLAKELPRIPRVTTVEAFRAFTAAGRRLAELHVGYESVQPFGAAIDVAGGRRLKDLKSDDFRVEKMRYGKAGKDTDKTVLQYNALITVRGIPERAHEYLINGKSAIDWVVERQGVRTDKASGIVNDANRYATETMGDPRYPLDLLLRVITVSLETLDIVDALPALEVLES